MATSPEDLAYQKYLEDQAYQQYLAEQEAAEAEDTRPRSLSGEPMTAGAPAPPAMPAGDPDFTRGPRIGLAAASRVVTGPGQLATALTEAISGRQGLTADYTEAVKGIEAKLIGGEPLNDEEREALDILAMGIGIAAPAGAVQKLGTGVTRVAAGVAQSAAAGGAGAAFSFDPNAEKAADPLTQAGIGAILGSTLGVGQAAFPAIRNWLFRAFRETPTPEQAKNIAAIEASPLTRDLGITNAQRTGSYESEVIEARVAGTKAQNFYNDQLNKLRERMQLLVRPGRRASVLGVDAQEALNSTKAKMQSEASKRYGGALDEADALAKADRANNFGMRTPNVVETLRDLPPADRLTALLDPADRKYAAELNMIIEKVNAEGGTLGMSDLIKLHRIGNAIRKGVRDLRAGGKLTPELASDMRLGKSLTQAAEADADLMIQQLNDLRRSGRIPPGMEDIGRGYEAAWQRFSSARAEYRAHGRAMREMEATAINQAFGKTARDPAKQWEALMRMEPEEQREALKVLRAGGADDTIADLKRWKLRQSVNKLTDLTKPGGVAPVNVEAFLKEITDGGRLVGNEFWSPAEYKNLQSVVAYMRTIQNRAPIKGAQIDIESPIMAFASQSSAFLARWFYRAFAQGRLEELFFSKKGMESLKALATTSDPKSASAQAALQYVIAQANNDTPPVEEYSE